VNAAARKTFVLRESLGFIARLWHSVLVPDEPPLISISYQQKIGKRADCIVLKEVRQILLVFRPIVTEMPDLDMGIERLRRAILHRTSCFPAKRML
jgi:hypothetical protein